MPRSLSLRIGRYVAKIELGRRKKAPGDNSSDLDLSYAQALERHLPELRQYGLDLNAHSSPEILAFYLAIIPVIHEPSRGAHLRSLLNRLRQRTKDLSVQRAATRAIALSNLSDGMPDRALCLRDDSDEAKGVWSAQVDALERAYGASLVHGNWERASRGASLVLYFDTHRSLLRGKSVAHFAPESEVGTWVEQNQPDLNLQYVTIDATQSNVDAREDITGVKMKDECFDMIICHRVMEHVSDDARGFREMYRLLRPGGVLNFSVPQAPHRATTAEWLIPDESHSGHVRHYGADLVNRMQAAGFRVELESYLLERPADVLRKHNAYPMRMFNAWRR
jgi:hypothetical protein